MPQIEIRPVKENEMEAARTCIGRSFSKNGEQLAVPGFFNQFQYPPLPHSDYFWAVFVDSQPVAGVMLVPFTIQIDGGSFTAVGLTGVGTLPEHRHKGYSSQLLQKLHHHLIMKGYDGAVLHSAADLLYKKNGYEFAFCAWEAEFECTESNYCLINAFIEAEQKSVEKVFFVDHLSTKYKQLSEQIALELFNLRLECPLISRRHVKIPLTFQRFFSKLQEKIKDGSHLSVLYKGNTLIGYILANIQPNKIEIIDCISIYDEKFYYLMLWKGILDEFSQTLCSVSIKTFKEDRLVHSIVQDLKGTIHRNMFTGNMVQFFNPPIIMRQMQSIFTHRLQGAHVDSITTHFFLSVEEKHMKIDISKGLVHIIPLSEEEFCVESARFSKNSDRADKSDIPLVEMDLGDWTALIFGYISAAELYEDEDNMDKAVKKALIVMFPELNPVWDYYVSY